MASTNKVKFGIKNCYFAVATIGSNGSATYGSPVALPGAVSMSLSPEGEMTPFYADDIVYYTAPATAGYSGDLELALIPDSFKTAVLGFAADANGVIYEDANAEAKHFALTFEFSGDAHKKRGVLYNCTATRPAVASATIGETKEPQTETITITATSVYNASLNKDVVKASATPTESTQYNAWNTTIYQPVATAST